MAERFRRCTLASKFGTYPKITPCGWSRFESCTSINIYRLSHGKSTFTLNFLQSCHVAQWPRDAGNVHWPQKLGPSKKSYHRDNAGSGLIRLKIFTCYPIAKVHIGQISYKLLCGPMAEGSGDIQWPQNFGPGSLHSLREGKNHSFWTTTNPWIDWDQQLRWEGKALYWWRTGENDAAVWTLLKGGPVVLVACLLSWDNYNVQQHAGWPSSPLQGQHCLLHMETDIEKMV